MSLYFAGMRGHGLPPEFLPLNRVKLRAVDLKSRALHNTII
jgi:hypothetical protein